MAEQNVVIDERANGSLALRRLIYTSTATRTCDDDCLADILRSSRDNNVLYSVSGILWSDGDRFIQVLEGPSVSVQETYDRIVIDERHDRLVIIYDQIVETRDFGSWSMCSRRSYETEDEYDRKIARALASVSSAVRVSLHSFIGSDTG